jgi:hypothetical protein
MPGLTGGKWRQLGRALSSMTETHIKLGPREPPAVVPQAAHNHSGTSESSSVVYSPSRRASEKLFPRPEIQSRSRMERSGDQSYILHTTELTAIQSGDHIVWTEKIRHARAPSRPVTRYPAMLASFVSSRFRGRFQSLLPLTTSIVCTTKSYWLLDVK